MTSKEVKKGMNINYSVFITANENHVKWFMVCQGVRSNFSDPKQQNISSFKILSKELL